MSVAPPAEGLRARRRTHLIQELHDIALRLFEAQGYEAMSLKQVADEAGISLRTLFRHFGSKDALLGYGIEATEADILSRLRERPTSEPLLDAYLHAIDGMLARSIADIDGARRTQRLLEEVPAIRAQYLVPTPRHRLDAMDEELARRLGREPTDSYARLVRAVLVTAVIHAMSTWIDKGGSAELRATTRDFLQLLSPLLANVAALPRQG
jgi:AcrR family transcriptional regulator